MSRHSLKPVTLKYSHAVKGRKNYRDDYQYGVYSGNAFDRKVKDGQVLDKSIHSYRMWFYFLKLGLELEQQNVELVTRNSIKGYTPGFLDEFGDTKMRKFIPATEIVSHKVKVNKSKYKDWSLDTILDLEFDPWWKEHKHLFLDQVGKVLKPNDIVSSDVDVFTYQIDKRRRMIDVISDLKQHYKDNRVERVTREKYSINGKLRPIILQNRFNALVLKLEDNLSNDEILNHKNNYIKSLKKHPHQGEYGRIIFELIGGSKKSFGAKQILLSVCDGYFVKHPTKTYLE